MRTHSYGGENVREVVADPRIGGRLYEVTDEGEQDWGAVLAWEPPTRLLLDWQIGSAKGTEVEVTFAPEGPGTRVVLEHSGFAEAESRGNYAGGWDVVLGTYVDSASKKA